MKAYSQDIVEKKRTWEASDPPPPSPLDALAPGSTPLFPPSPTPPVTDRGLSNAPEQSLTSTPTPSPLRPTKPADFLGDILDGTSLSVMKIEPIHEYLHIHKDGSTERRPIKGSAAKIIVKDWEKGAIYECEAFLPEGISSLKDYIAKKGEVLVPIHGWWGKGSDFRELCSDASDTLRVASLSFTLTGHGESALQSPSLAQRIFGNYAQDAKRILEFTANIPKVLLLHSAASHWFQQGGDLVNRYAHAAVKGTAFYAPMTERGPALSIGKYLLNAVASYIDGNPVALRQFSRQFRKNGLHQAMTAYESVANVLFNSTVSRAFVEGFIKSGMVGVASYGDYVWNTVKNLFAPYSPKNELSPDRKVLIHAGGDKNYTHMQQALTADRWKVKTFRIMEDVPHHAHCLDDGRALLLRELREMKIRGV